MNYPLHWQTEKRQVSCPLIQLGPILMMNASKFHHHIFFTSFTLLPLREMHLQWWCHPKGHSLSFLINFLIQWISQIISATSFTISSLTHMCKTIYQFTGITKTYCIIWLFQLTMFCCNFMISSSCLLDLRFHHGLIIFYSVQEKIPFKDSSRFIFNYSLQSFWWWTLMFMFSQFSKVECIWLWYQSFVDYPLKKINEMTNKAEK